MGNPAHGATDSENHGKHRYWYAQRLEDDARVEVDIGVELLLDAKIGIVERDFFSMISSLAPISRFSSWMPSSARTNSSIRLTSPISSSIFTTASLAPPCDGPQRAAIPAAMQANGLARDDPASRTVEVEAFCRICTQ